jgi:hypothetical protein
LNRLWLIARLLACWAIGLVVGSSFFSLTGDFRISYILIPIMALFSLPHLALAAAACAIFPRSIGAHPFLWTCGAVIAAYVLSYLWIGWEAFFSFIVSVPAGVAFLASVAKWPLPKLAESGVTD